MCDSGMKNEFRLSENRLQQNILICITIQSKFDFPDSEYEFIRVMTVAD